MIFDNPYSGGYFPQTNYNPYNYQNYTTKNASQPVGGSFIWVNSRKEAEEYPLGANGAQMMMNRNEKVFYLKACDGFGMVQYFKEFPYYEKNNLESSENTPIEENKSSIEYVSRKEFDELKAEIEAIKSAKKPEIKEINQNDE